MFNSGAAGVDGSGGPAVAVHEGTGRTGRGRPARRPVDVESRPGPARGNVHRLTSRRDFAGGIVEGEDR